MTEPPLTYIPIYDIIIIVLMFWKYILLGSAIITSLLFIISELKLLTFLTMKKLFKTIKENKEIVYGGILVYGIYLIIRFMLYLDSINKISFLN